MATTAQPDAKWQRARLISGYGIKGDAEQEQRAVSALLAVLAAVPDFGRDIVTGLGAPSGRITTYTEVRFDDEESSALRPDGAIVVERGQTRWSCLLEVKTGGSPLRKEQIEAYLDIARAHSVNGLLTISNDIVSQPTELPVAFDQRRAKGLIVRHLSWYSILTSAIEQKEHHGINDPDQAWILGELIRYLQDDRSGASGFEDMGQHWVRVRDGARDLTLRPADPAVKDVADRWEQFVESLTLELRQSLGRPVAPIWARNTTRASRLTESTKVLAQDGVLHAAVRVPDAAAALDLEANLRTRQLTTSCDIAAPREGRPATRVNWLLRQVREAPPKLRVEVRFPNAKEPVSALLADALKHPERLLLASDPKREPRTFKLALAHELGRKTGRGPGSFVGDSRQQLLTFYREVLQGLRAWQPPAPRLPGGTPQDAVTAGSDAPDIAELAGPQAPEPPTPAP